ncbi:hypothetical protein [Streptomyces asiaticus]|uniref:hypothetical protein n=1 Tax=Streptomyces asiaticus TaxID=114695 RepID=UPI003F67CA5A
MTDQTPAALLRAAAEKVRQWAADATADPWTPGAAARFGPELAGWLDSAAVDAEQIGADPRALATARKILGEESAR